MMNMSTTMLYKELSECKQDEELLLYLKNYEKFQINWKNYIMKQLMITGLSYKKFGDICGFSKNTIKSWCEEGVIPRNREHYIKLGFGLGMSEQEVNHLLTTYGGYQALYPKDIYDAICIYLLKKRRENMGDARYEYGTLKLWYKQYAQYCGEHRVNPHSYREIKTYNLHRELLAKEDETEFFAYIESHRDVFCNVYSKLVTFMENCIQIRRNECEKYTEHKMSVHQLFCQKNLEGSFEVAFSKLKRHGIVPKRQQLIRFGIAMNMTRNEIDYMLSLANMKPLCVRNRVECVLLYLLQQFEEKYPDVALENAFKMERITSNPEVRNRYQQVIRYFYDTEDVEYEENELTDELAVFVKKGMERLFG